MSDLRKAAADALRALEVATTPLARDRQEVLRARDALRAALAQDAPRQHPPLTKELLDAEGAAGGVFAAGALAQEAEPVAELRADAKGGGYIFWMSDDYFEPGTKLYTAPPAAPAVSDVELIALLREARDVISDIDEESHNPPTVKYARDVNCRIEAALAAKEK